MTTDTQTLRAIGDMIVKEHPQPKRFEFPLEELQGVNLCDSYLTINCIKIVAAKPWTPRRYREGMERDIFVIERPTEVNGHLKDRERAELEPLLRERGIAYKLGYYPLGSFKQQREVVFDLELNIGYDYQGKHTVEVLDFGLSYGKIRLDGIEVDISHSGGTRDDGWADWTTGWSLVGRNRVKAFKAVINQFIPNRWS